ncbi:protoporphyrinogen oxidase [Pontibacter sp. BT310]|uniref:Coproporphyrinogen III oxidase n=1 Tax=Pontibacter populi TaxID=890055 RepID=A0ABS6XCJ2_9BACT|nr:MULTISPECIES: protoporphyrinogen oxidase [Pontibacter]MBJ6118862.1 protoporphyrinogen oxidase [Pontibacter sp. BT310]MBR0571290.1 protoporphyrinogen oxidase [Microvirga sp. STS03]MBW3365716.1 protoporphyrinogen oxidase [Pontibacter populi]
MRVAIIGAGISGLALAYYLQKLGVPYDLFEASENVGGNIKTVKEGGYLLELGPNSLQVTPELKTLIRELKLEQEVVPTAQAGYQRYVLHNGSYEKLPVNPFSLLSNTVFSWKTKLRILQEKEIPPADIDYETITQFFERRFGHGVIDYAVNPFIAGIYGGDPEKLLVHKALPMLKELETNYGSVLKGLMQHKGTQLAPENISFANGMQTLPNAIAEKLISLHTGHYVEMITRNQGKYIISCATTGDYDTQEYNLLVLALPALHAAELLHYTFPGMAAALQNIHYPPMAVVHSVYNRNDVSHDLNGYGALHPKAECPFAVGSIWSSSLFEGRCRPHEVLFTSFVGGAQFEEHALTNKDELMTCVHKELEETYGIKAEKPIFQHMHLWEHSIPQYDLYIEDAHHMAEQLEQDGLFIAANWQAGISVAGCIRHAKELAHKINLKRPAPSIAE